MNAVTQMTSINESLTEKEQFWMGHAKCQRESGLSRIAYCRKHQLNYDQFSYWKQKWRQQTTSARLLPVNLNKLPTITDIPQNQTICTLAFKNGHELKIHDKSILHILLSLWS